MTKYLTKQLEEGKVYRGSEFEVTLHCGRKAWWQEHEAVSYIASTVGAETAHFLLFHLVRDPSPWDGTIDTHSGGFTVQLVQFKKTLYRDARGLSP